MNDMDSFEWLLCPVCNSKTRIKLRLDIPCAATLATIRKEAASTRWMLLSALFQLVVAWVVTFAVYRIGLLL